MGQSLSPRPPPRALVRSAVLLAALLLLSGVSTAASPPPHVAWVLRPDTAPLEGLPLAARIAVAGPPGAAVEVRAALAGEGVEGAQAWNGTAWVRSDRYTLRWTLDEHGRAEGWVAVRAGGLGAGPHALVVRARDAAGRPGEELRAPLAPADGTPLHASAPGAAAVGAWQGTRLVALAPTHATAGLDAPWDLEGAFALAVPDGAEVRGLDAEGRDIGAVALPAPSQVRIAALLVDPQGTDEAEFVRLRNDGPATALLIGMVLQGPGWEAVIRTGSLAPGAEAAVRRNATAYASLTGHADGVAARIGGIMQLPNAGGSLALRHGAHLLDAVSWGAAGATEGWQGDPLPVHGAGELHRRFEASDEDRASDFDPAPWKASWGSRAPWTTTAAVASFTTPTALTHALAALAEARDEVLLQVYAFTHPALAAALGDAAARGVRVRILVEGAPVGGMSREQEDLLDGLASAGADVRTIGGSGRDRYGTAHAKFAVLDRSLLMLGSENWTPSGFPEDGRGNLGWGALVRDAELAAWFADVWREDADDGRGDVAAWEPQAKRRLADPPRVPVAPSFAPSFAPATVTALLVPDNAAPVLRDLPTRAEQTLDVEALQMPLRWGDGPSPIVEGLREAALRGVRVRILLDDTPDHRAAAAALASWAAEHAAPLEARVAREARVHNKGWVLDGHTALVGSINLGEASVHRNREAALLIEGQAAQGYAAAFEADWQAAGPAAEPARADPGLLAAPLAVLVVLAVWRGRRGGRT